MLAEEMTTPARIPDQLLDLFQEPALGHVSYLNGKGKRLREGAQVSVSIVSPKNPWHWVSISGHVVDVKPDENLAFIDRMAQRYMGTAYQRRTPREIFTIAIDRVSPTQSWG